MLIPFASAFSAPRLVSDFSRSHLPESEFTQWFFYSTMRANPCWFTTIVSTGLDDWSIVIIGTPIHAHSQNASFYSFINETIHETHPLIVDERRSGVFSLPPI